MSAFFEAIGKACTPFITLICLAIEKFFGDGSQAVAESTAEKEVDAFV